MYYSKSQAAFILTCEKFFDAYPHPYFWTFTFRDVMPDWRYARAWAGFTRDLQHIHGEMILGVKVLEVHPGGHGLHYHAILNQRISVQFVRRIGKRYGIGVVHVKKCNRGAIWYLVPYLRKDDGLTRGIRKWGTVGGFSGVKWADVVVDTPFQRNIEWLSKKQKVSFPCASTVWRHSCVYGDLRDWPESAVRDLGRHASELRSVTPAAREYVLRSDISWDTIQKPSKPLLDDAKAQKYVDGTRFGCMVMCNGRWVHEASASFDSDSEVPFEVLSRRVDFGEIETLSRDSVQIFDTESEGPET